jgi:hypothetical protein
LIGAAVKNNVVELRYQRHIGIASTAVVVQTSGVIPNNVLDTGLIIGALIRWCIKDIGEPTTRGLSRFNRAISSSPFDVKCIPSTAVTQGEEAGKTV